MGKIRMVELAKEKKVKVVDLLSLAKKLDIDAKNAMSSISVDDAARLFSNLDKLDTAPKESAVVAKSKKEEAEKQAPQEKVPAKAPVKAQPKAEAKPQEKSAKVEKPKAKKGYTSDKKVNQTESAARPVSRRLEESRRQDEERAARARAQRENKARGNQGGYRSNAQGGGQGGYRSNAQGGGQGGYRSNTQGGGQGGYRSNTQGGGQGGYRSNAQGGGQGGYRSNAQGGGQGGYRSNAQGGARSAGQGGGQGGYRSNAQGAGRQGGGQGGYRSNQQGGYRNRGLDNRGLERQLGDASAAISEVAQAQTQARQAYEENRNRRGNGRRKSKKQMEEERRMEDRRLALQQRDKAKAVVVKKDVPKVIKHSGQLTVGEISQQIGIPVSSILKTLLDLGIMATINHSLEADAIDIVAAEFDATVIFEEVIDETDLSLAFEEEEENEENLVSRPPVITIMGHVDHGKTTLLDALRKADDDVTAGEAGGITQHIGAYQIRYGGKKLTFLDTPGHEAFTSMRARGAQITDIAIIVVAADDGVMPQTKEAVEHAKAAGVPIIVAVNKIDKPDADKTQVMQGLTEMGLQPEEWGGETIFVEISAKMGTGLDTLIEMLTLVSEMQELKANPNRKAYGTVIEASLDKGKGSVATLLVQGGTLRIGDPIVVGSTHGRVRTMEDDTGRLLEIAEPSTPIKLTGLVGVPSAGDQFAVFESEKKARQIGESRQTDFLLEQRSKSSAMNLEDLNQKILDGDVKDINVLIKGDVQGSVEAVSQSFAKIDVEGIRVNIVRAGVGAISESDVMLAVASNAIIYGFNVRPDANARIVAESEGVEIRQHTIIYKALEELESAMKGMLDPEYEEAITGQLEVRALFKVTKLGTIAGCMVTDGVVNRSSLIRLYRDGILIHEGTLGSLRRETDDVKKVSAGYECGVTIEGYNDIRENDIIEAYEMQEIERV